jgi:hypothetical protein
VLFVFHREGDASATFDKNHVFYYSAALYGDMMNTEKVCGAENVK